MESANKLSHWEQSGEAPSMLRLTCECDGDEPPDEIVLWRGELGGLPRGGVECDALEMRRRDEGGGASDAGGVCGRAEVRALEDVDVVEYGRAVAWGECV